MHRRAGRARAGPLCTVVRVEGRCVRADGTGIDPQPRAVYDWFYFHDSPRIYVQGTVRQDTPRSWVDAATGTLLLGTDHAPVFDLALRREGSTDEERLSSESGWGDVTVGSGLLSDAIALRWRKPAGATALGDLEVTVRLRPDAECHRVSWSLEARGQAEPWSVWEVRFPQAVLAAPGSCSQLALPQASGVRKAVGAEPLARFRGDYPSGWTTLPFAALYDTDAGTGLYFGLHDPSGANKTFTADRADRREAVVHPSKGALPPAAAASTAVSLSWAVPALIDESVTFSPLGIQAWEIGLPASR
ncbi:MAG: hypothetical protein BWK77_07510 [Verrucomicrobia bacterium A1]|nr:MAG: hypothetical protein BWK77_07510 [Verrucomicrobia bacterium A1]